MVRASRASPVVIRRAALLMSCGLRSCPEKKRWKGHRGDQRPGGAGSEHHGDHVQVPVERSQGLKPRRESDTEQEPEQDLGPGLTHPDLLQHLAPQPVGTLLRGLLPARAPIEAIPAAHARTGCAAAFSTPRTRTADCSNCRDRAGGPLSPGDPHNDDHPTAVPPPVMEVSTPIRSPGVCPSVLLHRGRGAIRALRVQGRRGFLFLAARSQDEGRDQPHDDDHTNRDGDRSARSVHGRRFQDECAHHGHLPLIGTFN